MALYKKLGDSFDRHDGSLRDYYKGGIGTPIPIRRHYDLRAFHTHDITAKWTMLDMQLWNVGHFGPGTGFDMDSFSSPHSLIGAETRRRTMDDLSIAMDGGTDTTYFTMAQIDVLDMGTISFSQVSSGNEDWPVGDPDVTVGRDAAYRYSNTIRVDVDATEKIVPSYFYDDILTESLTGQFTLS